jgi:hypothetical protein
MLAAVRGYRYPRTYDWCADGLWLQQLRRIASPTSSREPLWPFNDTLRCSSCSTHTCSQLQGMAPTPFEGASGNVALISKTRAALEASCDKTWCRQTTSELRLLETVLSQVKDISPTTASEETIRILGLFGLAHAPHLEYFLQELGKLQPDLDCYFGEDDRPGVKGPPLWATAVERNTTALMNNIGTQLQLTSALLRVESLRNTTARKEIQQITKTSTDILPPATATNVPSQQYIMAGNENVYQGIQISGSARVHIGESYSYLGVPKASVDKISEKINELATSNQADALQSLLQQIQKKQSDGCSGLSVLGARTQQVLDQLRQTAHAIATANEAPSLSINAQNKQLRKTTLKRPAASISANMSSILEILRIWLSAMIMTLRWGVDLSRDSFVLRERSPSRQICCLAVISWSLTRSARSFPYRTNISVVGP